MGSGARWRWALLFGALVAIAKAACSPFGSEGERENDAGAGTDGGDGDGGDGDGGDTLDSGALNDGSNADGGGPPDPFSCADGGWDICETFDDVPAPSSIWADGGAGGMLELGVTAERSASPPNSLKASSTIPIDGAEAVLTTSLTASGWRGIECTIAVRPEALSQGETRVLSLDFTPAMSSLFSSGKVGMFFNVAGAVTSVFFRTEYVSTTSGQGAGTSAPVVLKPGWERVTMTIDLSASSTAYVKGHPGTVSLTVPNFRPVESISVRMGAAVPDATGPTRLYLDDVACRGLR